VFDVGRRVLALCLGGLLAFGWFAGWTALFKAPADQLAGETLTLSGTVASYPSSTSVGGYSVTVALDGGLTVPSVLVYGTEDWGTLTPGDRVSFTARLRSSGQVYGEESTYYSSKSLFLLGYCSDGPEQVERAEHTPLRYWPVRCAQALKDSLSAAFDETVSPLAIAVTTGDKSGLSQQVKSALNRSGAAHTVAVSGMHISLLVSVALALSRNRRRTALLIVPALLFYALMAGGTPSALRAVIMQSVFLAAPIAKRENDGPTSLGLALLVLLFIAPYSAASISLQLSFASVAGILAVTPALDKRMMGRVKKLGKGHAGKGWAGLRRALALCSASLSASLGAMLFAMPLVCWYFRQCSIVFPLTNLLILWAVWLFFVLALVAGTVGVLLPGPAAALGAAAGLLGRYVLAVVTGLGAWRLSSLDSGNFYELLCFAAIYLFAGAAVLFRRERMRPWVPLGCFALLVGAAVGLNRLEVVVWDLTVTVLDVGQGSCTAFLSGEMTCLVDCGGIGTEDAGDVAADYFATQGVSQLDLLVLTHFDSDHTNGVEELFYRMDVAAVAIADVEEEYGQRERVLELAQAEGAQVLLITGTTELSMGDTARLTIYPPLSKGTSNEEGLFVLCSAGRFDTLITGDADSFVEKMLVKYYNIPDIELLVVGHHGSAGSTSEELLDAARPESAIISVGYNSYGHPAEETLERLAERDIQVYRTDTMGSVTIYVRSDGYAAKTEK
jgi:competence protein ComEC